MIVLPQWQRVGLPDPLNQRLWIIPLSCGASVEIVLDLTHAHNRE